MSFDLAPKLAKILTEYSIPIKEGDRVAIIGNVNTAGPLIEALVSATLRRGGSPSVQGAAMISPDYTDYFELFLREASDAQLDAFDSNLLHFIDTSDVLYFIKAPGNTKALASVDPARIARFRRTNKPFSDRYLERYDAGELMWNVTAWPTAALAQNAEMGLHAYTEFVAKACGLDQPDPVAYWSGFRERQTALVEWLAGKKHAEVTGPGIELSFDFQDRPWVSCHGELNFPDGEIFTSPVEDSVNGYVNFNMRSVYLSSEVDGVKLRFEDGVAVDASASKGEAFLLSQLDVDEGARTLGEFAIGTNWGVQDVTGNILFDEKIGGSIHMALGKSYAESNGTNQSAIHWDMVNSMKDGGRIVIDGELFYDSGKFLVE
ncbi:aminopeptidase [Aggregatilinea lenta]|uniref:aminopeptidase n=1 Tax=Aggregatilinea lenta TaxID=913108 RepID=UPI000E5B3F9B|nr:aminopeptidase [Aggregatilinea lenta]